MTRSTKIAIIMLALTLSGCGSLNNVANSASSRAQMAWYRHMVCMPTTYSAPAWSPDGTKIYYTLFNGATARNDLRVMDSQGGNDHLLVSNAGMPLLSPDGKWLVYWDYSGTSPYGTDRSMINLATMEIHSLGDLGPAPTWSPDSTSILYTLLDSRAPLTRYIVDTGQRIPVLEPQKAAAFGDGFPIWSPTGDRIAFISDRSGAVAIHTVGADGTGLSRLSGQDDPTCKAGTYLNDITLMGWRPDGEQIAFVRLCGQATTLNVLPAAGGEMVWSYSAAYIYPAAWSRDGKHILMVVQDPSVGGSKLMVGDADGSNLKDIAANASEPAWSPDGKRIAYVSWDQSSGQANMFSIASDGSDLRQLTQNPGVGVICPH